MLNLTYDIMYRYGSTELTSLVDRAHQPAVNRGGVFVQREYGSRVYYGTGALSALLRLYINRGFV
jgi:hypothetical protein